MWRVTTAEAPVRWGMGDAAMGTLLTLVLPILVGITALSAAGITDPDDLALWAVALLQVPLWVGLLGVPVFATQAKGRRSLAVDFGLRMKPSDIPLGLAVGIAAQIVLLLVLGIVYDLVGVDADQVGESARELTDGAEGVLDVVLLVLIVGIAAPVFEELFYRGLWLRAIERRAGPAVAVIGSSVIFGAIHFQLYDFPALAAFGLVAAVLTVRTGRLGPAIWAHLAFNMAAVVGLLA